MIASKHIGTIAFLVIAFASLTFSQITVINDVQAIRNCYCLDFNDDGTCINCHAGYLYDENTQNCYPQVQNCAAYGRITERLELKTDGTYCNIQTIVCGKCKAPFLISRSTFLGNCYLPSCFCNQTSTGGQCISCVAGYYLDPRTSVCFKTSNFCRNYGFENKTYTYNSTQKCYVQEVNCTQMALGQIKPDGILWGFWKKDFLPYKVNRVTGPCYCDWAPFCGQCKTCQNGYIYQDCDGGYVVCVIVPYDWLPMNTPNRDWCMSYLRKQPYQCKTSQCSYFPTFTSPSSFGMS